MLEKTDSVAFLVLKDGKIYYERYWNDYQLDRPVMLYSITKSILSLLLGLAIEDGLIQSLDQPVSDFLPTFNDPDLKAVRIEHLLQMTSGLPYVERTINNPFGLHAHLTYTDDITGLLQTVEAGVPPGTRFVDKSVDYALLGRVLQVALKGESITAYLQRRLWFPLGAVYPATWSVDSVGKGVVKTWCCLAMTARDLARFGVLMQDRGQWQGRQLIPRDWVKASLSINTEEGSIANYQYGWWLMPGEPFAFRAEGILGQFLFVLPANRIVIVRLGKSLGNMDWSEWARWLTQIARLVGTVG